jgi:hypothetical protein
VLSSRAFQSYDYFREGLERLESAGKPTACLRHFFEHGLLFREGRPHHEDKHVHRKLLDAQCEQLQQHLPRLLEFFEKRSFHITDPLTFSRLFVRLCLGLTIRDLTSAPLAASMRAIRGRENVFYYHFHPARHRRLDAAVAALRRSIPGDNGTGDAAWLIALSLLVMGYDPLVATLCAGLSGNDAEPLSSAPARYCATSFVARICVEETAIDGHRCAPGDICYVSLVPARDDAEDTTTFPFGLGIHNCVGKRLSVVVLELADAVVSRCFPRGFHARAAPRGDGAFLGFSGNAIKCTR